MRESRETGIRPPRCCIDENDLGEVAKTCRRSEREFGSRQCRCEGDVPVQRRRDGDDDFPGANGEVVCRANQDTGGVLPDR